MIGLETLFSSLAFINRHYSTLGSPREGGAVLEEDFRTVEDGSDGYRGNTGPAISLLECVRVSVCASVVEEDSNLIVASVFQTDHRAKTQRSLNYSLALEE